MFYLISTGQKTGKYIDELKIEADDLGIKEEDSNEGYAWKTDLKELDIQDNFDKIKSCRVCAMGACILSITKFKTN